MMHGSNRVFVTLVCIWCVEVSAHSAIAVA
jgi:hypothetical protein